MEQVERRGGFMSINHPVADDCAWLHPLERMPPGAELFHGTWYRNLAGTSILAWAAWAGTGPRTSWPWTRWAPCSWIGSAPAW